MNIRLVAVCVMLIGLAGCFGSEKKRPELNQPEVKADFHKAALLNVEMGEAYLAQSQVSRAKQKFVHALELQPKLPEAHSSFGYFYEQVGDLEEAEAHHKRAISFGRGAGKYYNNYGAYLSRQKRYKEADRAFNNALQDKSYIKTAEVYENAGLNALESGDLVKAREYLVTAIKRDPSRTVAAFELAKLEFDNKNYLYAKDYLERYKSRNNPTPKSVYLSLQLNRALKNHDELAKDILQLKKFPNSEECKQYLANASYR